MPFRATGQHIEEYRTLGYTVFRRILPASLVSDLRVACAQARTLARERQGPQAQRLQPLANFELDQRPFDNYFQLPELVAALHEVLSPEHANGGPTIAGVLFEPRDSPWATNWHRDWRDHRPHQRAEWEANFRDVRCFNQVNCALYDDDCTWIVPGCHVRAEDTPGERAALPMPDLGGLGAVDIERRLHDYCAGMPGAVQLRLGPGDYALYRNTLLHLGNYVPYRQRATIHDIVNTPRYAEFRAAMEAHARREAEPQGVA
jgi:hypothetical protein